ncbi:hypothetical protein BN12_770013 [Nostocoides japonicum T1-X7]|uniref:Uncharacterized protein n=1 Tax=Nostocoides japonicum T1-X7 TaxID=1194083 RepID=A0A077M7S5_9MICO|nr:hypothetical protein BN12_770013 [Tetrasphaera japonica T1-X7]
MRLAQLETIQQPTERTGEGAPTGPDVDGDPVARRDLHDAAEHIAHEEETHGIERSSVEAAEVDADRAR